MTRYQIICKYLSDDENNIQSVGLVEAGNDTSKYQYFWSTKKVNGLIQNGDTCFFTDEQGDNVEVSKFGDNWITTDPDDIEHNNLRKLPSCTPP